MRFENGYFYENSGKRYIPLGIFGCYFQVGFIGETLGRTLYHGKGMIAFQNLTVEQWHKFFAYLKKDGYTAIRMFPRGDSKRSAWEGLDLGGKVNRDLLQTILNYLAVGREYGIKCQLCLFTEMECSFYCEPNTRRYWGEQFYSPEEIESAPDYMRRFLLNLDDIVDYNDYYTDPDVRACNKRFLDELIPLIKNCEDIFSVEISNEFGWASPHAKPFNTFRWEITDKYLEWESDIAEYIKSLAPNLPLCQSNAGLGILGHDNIQWGKAVPTDFFSVHIYPDICGQIPESDYASAASMTLKYTGLARPAMFGEWQALEAEKLNITKRDEALLARDITWLSLLNGSPGVISWCAESRGEYRAVSEVFSRFEGCDLTPEKAGLTVNIGEAYEWFVSLIEGGEKKCRFDASAGDLRWCPDCSATDNRHRYCVKVESEYNKILQMLEIWSLESGVMYDLSLEEGKKISEISKSDISDLKNSVPIVVPAGYHAKVLAAVKSGVSLIYLRNYARLPVLGLYSLRKQEKRGLTLKFNVKNCKFDIFDLDDFKWTKNLSSDLGLYIGETDHDYIIILDVK
jgi:hypothetical protein